MSSMERSSRPNRKTSSTIGTIGSLVGLSIVGGFGFLAIFSDRFEAVHFVAGVLVFGGMDFLAVKLAKKWLVEPPPDADTTQKQSVPQHSTVASTRPQRTVTVQLDAPVNPVFDGSAPLGATQLPATLPDSQVGRPSFVAPASSPRTPVDNDGPDILHSPQTLHDMIGQEPPQVPNQGKELSRFARWRIKKAYPEFLGQHFIMELRKPPDQLFYKLDATTKREMIWAPLVLSLIAVPFGVSFLYHLRQNMEQAPDQSMELALYLFFSGVAFIVTIGLPLFWLYSRIGIWWFNRFVVFEENSVYIDKPPLLGGQVDPIRNADMSLDFKSLTAPLQTLVRTRRSTLAGWRKVGWMSNDTLAQVGDSSVNSAGPYKGIDLIVRIMNRVRRRAWWLNLRDNKISEARILKKHNSRAN